MLGFDLVACLWYLLAGLGTLGAGDARLVTPHFGAGVPRHAISGVLLVWKERPSILFGRRARLEGLDQSVGGWWKLIHAVLAAWPGL